MIAQIGSVRFEGLRGFDSFNRAIASVTPELALIGSKPRQQKTGNELQVFSLAVRLHASFTKPETDINTLKAYCDDSEIVPFIMGTGENLGDFTVSNVSVDVQFMTDNGAIVNAVVSFDLVEHYDPDKIATQAAAAKANADAIRNAPIRPLPELTISDVVEMRTPPEATLLTKKPYEAGAVASDLSVAKVAAAKLQSALDSAIRYPEQAALLYSQMQGKLSQVTSAMGAAASAVSASVSMASKFPNLLNSILNVGNLAGTFLSSLPAVNPGDLIAVNAAFQSAVNTMSREGVGLAILIATRKR